MKSALRVPNMLALVVLLALVAPHLPAADAPGDQAGETVTFTADPSGRVTRFEAPGYYLLRTR